MANRQCLQGDTVRTCPIPAAKANLQEFQEENLRLIAEADDMEKERDAARAEAGRLTADLDQVTRAHAQTRRLYEQLQEISKGREDNAAELLGKAMDNGVLLTMENGHLRILLAWSSGALLTHEAEALLGLPVRGGQLWAMEQAEIAKVRKGERE